MNFIQYYEYDDGMPLEKTIFLRLISEDLAFDLSNKFKNNGYRVLNESEVKEFPENDYLFAYTKCMEEN